MTNKLYQFFPSATSLHITTSNMSTQTVLQCHYGLPHTPEHLTLSPDVGGLRGLTHNHLQATQLVKEPVLWLSFDLGRWLLPEINAQKKIWVMTLSVILKLTYCYPKWV